MKDLIKMGAVLALICLAAAAALSQVNSVTKGPIAAAMEAEALEAAAKVLAPVMGDGATVAKREGVAGKENLYVAEREGRALGFAFIISTKEGYSGLIESMLGVDVDGNVLGFQIVQHAETPGLGANAKTDTAWLAQLIKKGDEPRNLDNTDWRVKKDGGEIDAVTSATISSRAVEARQATPDATPVPEPTPDASLEEGGVIDHNLPAAKPLPAAQKTPVGIIEKDLTE